MELTKLYQIVAKDNSYNSNYMYKNEFKAKLIANMLEAQLHTEFEVKTYLLRD